MRIVSFIFVASFLFGIMFGSPLGVLGDAVHFNPELKTKILLSLSIFGFFCLFYSVWIIILTAKENHDVTIGNIPEKALVAGFISATWAFGFQDCLIFTFCDN